MMKYTILILLLFAGKANASATFDTIKPPIQRQRFHDKINEEQKLLDKSDGKLDGIFKVSSNEEINLAVTDAMLRKVNALQDSVEVNNKIKANNEKVRYLTYIETLLRTFRVNWRSNKIKPVFAPMLVDNFEKIMRATIDSVSMVPYIDAVPWEVCNITADIFVTNPGYLQSKNIVYLKFCALNPDKILQTIAPYTKESFADSLVTATCKNDPAQVYKYAQDVNSLAGKLIHKSNSPAVKTLASLSLLPSPLLYFPFLDDIISGKKQTDSLKKIIGDGETGYDSVAYYKLLVQTEIEYSKRMNHGDTAIAFLGPNGLRDMLKRKANQHFINPINELHEKPENIRMKAIDPLSPVDIYYMIVMGDTSIYTSSYKHSFNRMLQRMGKKPATDSLLLTVNFDYFKKFIKMAANFNKLDTFLNLMPASSSEALMKGFVGRLEATATLEDAVDVADSYSSINNKNLLNNMLSYVNENEQRCAGSNNNRGKVIYNLLKTIFLSADSTNKIDLTTAIGIPPIYSIDNKALKDDSGRIVQQVFFYGDEDGRNFFPPYISSFSAKEWKKNDTNKEWVEFKSIKEPKNWVYVNRPLNNDKNLDDTAQIHLNNYLRKSDLTPSIITHRGHSYWLPRTMSRMAGDAKIVILGSCGGYKNLSQLIEINPDAHIISTKEIGTGNINQIITNKINQVLLSGKPIIWKNIWDDLSLYFAKQPKDVKEAWDDYIPPYKNLGAIFIKAYNKKVETE
ncbi:hypothetical protein [Ferruginibacter sp. SUN106]|uniref:hypothetical protein n=1 Tax=Ferruginibacter sp. SUN106 TaxID=2978348 RepID=UPI003D368947